MKIIVFLVSLEIVFCRDFYKGIFRRDDYLVAQDNVYKEKRPHSYTQTEYGRYFKCPITYFRVVDRLGIGPGPIVKIMRGGLLKKYIAIRIKSGYNLPISVNVYVGCENSEPRTVIVPWRTTKVHLDNATAGGGNGTDTSGNSTTVAGDGGGNTGAEGEQTTVAGDGGGAEGEAEGGAEEPPAGGDATPAGGEEPPADEPAPDEPPPEK